jgi:signal transduction histidine kinase
MGLLCVNGTGEVVLMNKALQDLFRRSYLHHLDAIRQMDEGLWTTIRQLPDGERQMIKLNLDNRLVQLSVQAIDFRLNKAPFRLIAFHNIQSELEAQELSAWQRLIRILTHEIMNSVAPIASLSATLEDMTKNRPQFDDETLQTLRQSIGVIRKRSEGLLDFTETYRRLMQVPPPKFQLLDARKLLEGVFTLFQPETLARSIDFTLHLPAGGGDIVLHADPGLLEQVLINLIKNAIDAVADRPGGSISIHLQRLNHQRIQIQVIDNGPGIAESLLEQIFVPFFTTKTHGSGIGLSLSRHIISQHKGSIEVQSAEGKGACVTLLL